MGFGGRNRCLCKLLANNRFGSVRTLTGGGIGPDAQNHRKSVLINNLMVEAAGIEPSLETDTIAALLAQKMNTNHTPETACKELIDTFHALSDQNRDAFLQQICAIYVQWAQLPRPVQDLVRKWSDLSTAVKKGVQ